MNINEYFNQFRGMKPWFFINEEQWTHIKETYPKDEVKTILAQILMEYSMPYAEISEQDAYVEFMRLKKLRYHEMIMEGEWFPRKAAPSRYPYTYKGKQLYISRLNTGNASSNFFQQENRWSVDGSVSPGPLRTWKSEAFMTSLMGAAYTLKLPQLGKSEIRTMIGLRKYICAQFKPSAGKAFYDLMNSKSVLDFSAGWGDRLAAFYTGNTTEHYVGLDPRKENHPIYEQQREFYEKHLGFFENEKTSEFHVTAAEDFDFSEWTDKFDTVFTSPPYFSVERYSYDDNQSWVRYKNIDDWNTNFLHKTLEKIIPTVKKGGVIAINIADVYTSSWLEICNPMNDFLTSKGLTYEGCIGIAFAKRPNSGGNGTAKDTEQFSEERIQESEELKDKIFAEPVWIFRK